MIANTSTLLIEAEGIEKPTDYNSIIMVILMGLTNILLISRIALTVLCVIKKEKKDYKYIISIIGYSIFILLAVISLI